MDEYPIAGSRSDSYSSSYTDPHNDLTHQWMMEANAFNAEQAQLNRDFQERMSSTAYQRAMSDLSKAGLNPILAGSLGPASTPGGGQAQANFTGAGATTSSSAVSHSQSTNLGEAMWNFGMQTLNNAVQNKYGKTIDQYATQGAEWFLDQINDFMNNATTNSSNGNGLFGDLPTGKRNTIQSRDGSVYEFRQDDWDEYRYVMSDGKVGKKPKRQKQKERYQQWFTGPSTVNHTE